MGWRDSRYVFMNELYFCGIICFMSFDPEVLRDQRKIEEFARRAGIDFADDTKEDTSWTPRLAVQNETGATTLRITDEGGTEYDFTQINYCTGEEVVANRMVAEIPAGQRTDLAYWGQAAPEKRLAIHKGLGALVLGNPRNGFVHTVAVDAFRANEAVLPAGHFYTIQAAGAGLTVSGFYCPPVDWSMLEAPFLPGAQSVTLEVEGTVAVPRGFTARFVA